MKRTDDITLARLDLNNALDFVGNPGLCQVSRCCLGASDAVCVPSRSSGLTSFLARSPGCFIYHRCHNLLPRLAQICMYTSLILAMAPWTFWKLFTSLPAGFNGCAGAGSVIFACAAILLVLDSIATPMAFMRKCV